MQCKHFLSDKQTDNSLIIANECQNTRKVGNNAGFNTRSSEIQGTELGKVPTGMACIDRSMPAGVAQSSHVFVGGTVSTWARLRIPVNKGRKGIRNADQALTIRGEHADRIVGSPSC